MLRASAQIEVSPQETDSLAPVNPPRVTLSNELASVIEADLASRANRTRKENRYLFVHTMCRLFSLGREEVSKLRDLCYRRRVGPSAVRYSRLLGVPLGTRDRLAWESR